MNWIDLPLIVLNLGLLILNCHERKFVWVVLFLTSTACAVLGFLRLI